jgi:hypothetical protein
MKDEKNRAFYSIVRKLKRAGYFMKITKEQYGNAVHLTALARKSKPHGHLVLVYISEWLSDGVPVFDVRGERQECYDKWSRAPVCLPLPKNHEEFKFLLDKLSFLATEEGKEFSNDCGRIYDYPILNNEKGE